MVVRSRDSRRRRVLLDESAQATSAAASVSTSSITDSSAANLDSQQARKRLYAYGADRRSQAKTTDLIPKRWFAYTSFVVFLIAAIASLNTLAWYAPQWQPAIGESGTAAFSLQGSGTLAAWFGSLSLGLAAAASWQIYRLRKHRCDDYRGSYRLWSWAAILLSACSVGHSIAFGEIAQQLLLTLPVQFPPVAGVSALALASLGMVGLLVLIGAIEMRRSRAAASLLVTFGLVMVTPVIVSLPAISQRLTVAQRDLVNGNSGLLAAALVLLAVVTYARYVYMAAHGLLSVQSDPLADADETAVAAPVAAKPQRRPVPKPTVKVAAQKPAAKAPVSKQPATAKSTPARATPAKPAAQRATTTRPTTASKPVARSTPPAQKAKPAAASSAQPAANAASDAPEENLSKAERRRRRKLDRRQNRAA